MHSAISVLTGRRGSRPADTLRAAVSAIVVISSVAVVAPAVTTSAALAPNGGAALADVSAALTRMTPARGVTVYTDWQTMRVLPIYRHPAFGGKSEWTAPVRSLTGKDKPRRGDFVLLVSSGSSPCGFCTAALAPWRKSHPALPTTWKQVFTSEGGGYTLYRVD
jgi:hypothetical protein